MNEAHYTHMFLCICCSCVFDIMPWNKASNTSTHVHSRSMTSAMSGPSMSSPSTSETLSFKCPPEQTSHTKSTSSQAIRSPCSSTAHHSYTDPQLWRPSPASPPLCSAPTHPSSASAPHNYNSNSRGSLGSSSSHSHKMRGKDTLKALQGALSA
jgi:hypothetical protein